MLDVFFVVLLIARVAFILFISGFALGIYGWRYMEWLKEGKEGRLSLRGYQKCEFFFPFII